ncbi:MAG: hypothetical protein KUG77_19320 [Nannocystaceae bacterium]|nr:hypothetical protein [Nannocystaceae bacterium]
MRTASEHVAAEDFESARRVLNEAYSADPRPELLYSRAQVERLTGQCDEAHRLFEQFASEASDEDAADARRLSAQCTPAEPPVPLIPPAEAEPTAPAPPVAVSVDPPSSENAWSRRPLPAAMMGVGLGALGVGAGLLVYASVDRPTPSDAQNEGDYGELTTRSRRLNVTGAVVAAVGASLAIGAGIIWTVLARRQHERAVSLAPSGLSIRF